VSAPPPLFLLGDGSQTQTEEGKHKYVIQMFHHSKVKEQITLDKVIYSAVF